MLVLDWTLIFRRYNTVMKIVFLGESVGLHFSNSTGSQLFRQSLGLPDLAVIVVG